MQNLFFPEQASTIASKVDQLYFVLIALSILFALPIAGLIIYFGIKYRRGSRADRSGVPHTSIMLEVSWISVMLIVSMVMFLWGSRVYVEMYQLPPTGLDIYVLGKQWMWQFQYPTGQRTINVLTVPTGQPVRLTLISQDVIHSFYVPAFRIKRDVLPGRYTTVWFEATQTGEYHLFCAEYCGTEHAGMIGRVVVLEPRQYEEWLRQTPLGQAQPIPEQNTGSVSEPQAMAQGGAGLFNNLGCANCHAASGQGVGPALVGLWNSQVQLSSGETVTADVQYIRRSIIDPQAQIVAGYPPVMPTYAGQITEEELLLLVEYIRSLGETGAGSNQ